MSDEAFFTDRLESTFRKLGKSWPVTLLPGVGHIPLTLEPVAIKASINAIEDMQSSGANDNSGLPRELTFDAALSPLN
jgi:hypothetical protein